MKKTNAQFAIVFVGVLLLHLAAATALMKSAQTDASEVSVAPDPTYHSPSPGTEPVRGPKEAREERLSGTLALSKAEGIPDAFAAAGTPAKAVPTPKRESVPPPPIPLNQSTDAGENEPVPENTSTRQLTVSQLLAAEQVPRVKPEAKTERESAAATDMPRVKPSPSIDAGKGPRKIRSLSGN